MPWDHRQALRSRASPAPPAGRHPQCGASRLARGRTGTGSKGSPRANRSGYFPRGQVPVANGAPLRLPSIRRARDGISRPGDPSTRSLRSLPRDDRGERRRHSLGMTGRKRRRHSLGTTEGGEAKTLPRDDRGGEAKVLPRDDRGGIAPVSHSRLARERHRERRLAPFVTNPHE